jgi:hypothetical protein
VGAKPVKKRQRIILLTRHQRQREIRLPRPVTGMIDELMVEDALQPGAQLLDGFHLVDPGKQLDHHILNQVLRIGPASAQAVSELIQGLQVGANQLLETTRLGGAKKQ